MSDVPAAVLRCYLLGAASCLFGVLSWVAPGKTSLWADAVSAVLAAILLSHVINMILRVL